MANKTFKELTEEDIKFISDIHSNKNIAWNYRMLTLTTKFGVIERTIRKWIKRLGLSNKNIVGENISEQYEEAKKKKHQKKKYFLVTWGQNNTDIHSEMLKNMKAYADFLDGEILVVAGRYRNPTSLQASDNVKHLEKAKIIKWHNDILPYLTANRHNLHKYLMVLADVKTQPTAEKPLTGFEGFSGMESSILGHPKQHLKSLPILQDYPHKVLASTGAITLKNYTDTKAGKKGEFNHVFGFLVVEIRDDKLFHIRNVNVAESGEFNDLFFNVKEGAVTRNETIEAISFGDLHSGWEDKNILNKTFDLLDILKPKHVFLDDVFDGRAISHHHEKDPFLKYEKSQSGEDNLKKEIDNLMILLSKFKKYDKVIVKRANHDDHLDKYLRERDWKRDIINALEYMELSTIILKGKAPKGIIPYLIEQEYPEFVCLGVNDSYIVKGIENGLHGDKGANGSRGGAIQFKKLSIKTNTAHTHSPEILDGSFVAGTSSVLYMEYNDGLSSWMNGHIFTDSLGKRQQLLFIEGEFTTLMDKLIA